MWCSHKDLRNDSFGWCSPFHHLVAWAYSSLKLRELYPDVELYTDSEGAKVLIDKLKLPYTQYSVEYDDLRCNPCLWAYPKILTYGKQVEPFIHVDGDVFIYEKFDDELVNSRLIVQNLELSTNYYADIFRPVLKKLRYVPDVFKDNLSEKFPKSYNAGILGGTDIRSMQLYTEAAVKFVGQNHLCHSNGNFNMIFEQLLFYSVAQKQNISPGCYFNKVYNDNGYALKEMADFFATPGLKYLHLIGRLKRDKFICDQLVRRFFFEYPDYFERVSALFKSPFHTGDGKANGGKFTYPLDFSYPKTRDLIHNLYPGSSIGNNEGLSLFVKENKNRVLGGVYRYEEKIHRLLTRNFAEIDMKELRRMEEKVYASATLFNELVDDMALKIRMTPYVEIFETPFDVIHFNPYEILRGKTDKKIVACVPHIFAGGVKEIDLDTLCAKILSVVHKHPKGVTFRDLADEISELFNQNEGKIGPIRDMVMDKLKFLVGTNLLYLEKAKGKE
nr:DUF6734 family protein [Proteiniphilum sp. UBA5384]